MNKLLEIKAPHTFLFPGDEEDDYSVLEFLSEQEATLTFNATHDTYEVISVSTFGDLETNPNFIVTTTEGVLVYWCLVVGACH